MFRSLVSWFLLVYLRRSNCIEEDNLGNALNSIQSRQRQLASHYYSQSNTDTDRGFPVDDDSLMYLGNIPSNYDASRYNRFVFGKPAKNSRGAYKDEYVSDFKAAEYQKALNERLLDQLVLDILNSEDEAPHHRAQKKSFFREREINDVSESLQNLQPDLSFDETLAPKFKSKLYLPRRRVSQSYDSEDDDNYYLNAVDPLWRKYEGQSLRNRDPETLDPEAVDAFVKYLAGNSELYVRDDDDDDDNNETEEEEDDDDDYYTRETYTNENRNHDRDRSKRYWLGSNQPSQIRKRSTDVPEKARPLNGTTLVQTANKTVNDSRANNRTTIERSQTEHKRDKKGQKEVPVDLKSLKPLNIRKKSIDWSNYFGVDKRQKKSSTKTATPKSDVLLDQYIQSYILQSVRDSAFNNRGSDYRNRFPKRNIFRAPRLEGVETAEDLKNAEDMIIDHVLKFTGAHLGTTNPQALRRYKERVINELRAAYNLEKLRNEIATPNSRQWRTKRQHQHTDDKRVAVKKENAELSLADVDGLKTKHNDSKTTGKNYDNVNISEEDSSEECSILDQVTKRCSAILNDGIYSYDDAFHSTCIYHSICDICSGGFKENSVTGPMHCNLDFVAGMDIICLRRATRQHCLERGRQVLEALRSQESQSFFARSQCDRCIGVLFA